MQRLVEFVKGHQTLAISLGALLYFALKVLLVTGGDLNVAAAVVRHQNSAAFFVGATALALPLLVVAVVVVAVHDVAVKLARALLEVQDDRTYTAVSVWAVWIGTGILALLSEHSVAISLPVAMVVVVVLGLLIGGIEYLFVQRVRRRLRGSGGQYVISGWTVVVDCFHGVCAWSRIRSNVAAP